MKMFHKFTKSAICLVAAATLATPAVLAQEENVPAQVALTLQQAQELAMQRNTTIQNASLDVRKAEADKWQAIANMLPQVKAQADYSNYFGYEIPISEVMKFSMPQYVSGAITSSIAFSGVMVVSSQIAGISKKMSEITLRKTEKEVCDQVKVLYYTALVTDESVRLLEENLKSMNQLYNYTLSSVNVGVSESTDADQLLVQVRSMENAVSSTQRALEVIYNSMRIMLNISENTEIVLLQDIDSLIGQESLQSLLEEPFVMENNYDFQLLKQSLDLTKKQLSMAGWANSPTLSFYHQMNKKKYLEESAMKMDMTPPNMIGATISIPIFTSLKNTKAYQSAKISLRKQQNLYDNMSLSLRVQHRQLVYNLKSTMEKYETQRQSVEVAKRVFDNISKKYEFGVASSMDVTNSGTNYVSAQSNYVSALLEMVEAQINLEQLLNK